MKQNLKQGWLFLGFGFALAAASGCKDEYYYTINEDSGPTEFTFQQGFAGYTGAQDTTLQAAMPAPGSSLGTSHSVQILPYAFRGVALMRFNLTEVSAALLKAGDVCEERLQVNQASLRVYVTGTGTPGYIMLNRFKSDSPRWEEDSATWTQARTSTPWPAPAGAGYPWEYSSEEYFEGVALPDGFARGMWVEFNLPRWVVVPWICHPDQNNGFVVSYSVPGTATANDSVTLLSKEFSGVEYHPMVVITAQRAED